MPRAVRAATLPLVVLACVGALALAGITHSSAARAPSVPTQLMLPTRVRSGDRIAIGVTIANAPGYKSVLQNYIGLAGKAPAMVMDFRSFSDPLFYSTEEPNLRAIGAIPVITWDPVINGRGLPLADVSAGLYDAYLNSQARAAEAWGRPMYIRFAHEMNLPDSKWATGKNGNTPASYVAAWRHVVTIFRDDGATNVRWIWSPNVYCHGSCPFAAYFPGDAWVDEVALDGYNFASAHGVPWISFASLFGPSYALITAISQKPVMIAETASAGAGGDKAAWMRQAFLHDVPVLFPRINAVIWWDRDDGVDWRVNSSPASLTAWRAVVSSPLYSG
jgi:Glycosyl hydrolase family 26